LRVLSFNDLLVLHIILLTQRLNDQFHIDLTMKYLWYCKIRTYATYRLYGISPYSIVLVCIDRLYRTSKYSSLRDIATPRIARKIVITIIPIFLFYFHILFQYNIIYSICHPLIFSYYHFLSYLLLVFYCLLPPILMSIFSSWTLILLHRHRQKQEKKLSIKNNLTI
ncbi:unnamed protein product, partial [Rotaria sp. Silwood2]